MRCPCRKKRETETYAECCEPYHMGQKAAPTAEALMRSRYSAFALKDATYLDRDLAPIDAPIADRLHSRSGVQPAAYRRRRQERGHGNC